jgi:sugar-specific transcriptional regulator TrmB
MDNQTKQLLEKIGLKETEARFYLTALEIGPTTMQHIAKKAGLHRATAYQAFDSLAEKNLLEYDSKSYGRKIAAVAPKKVIALIEKHEREWRKIKLKYEAKLPMLEALRKSDDTLKPNVYFYEGMDQVKQSWFDHLNQVPSDEPVIYNFGVTTFQTLLDRWPSMHEEYIEIREKKGFDFKLLAGGNDVHNAMLKDQTRTEIRVSDISSTIMSLEVQFSMKSIHLSIYDENPTALIIENQTLSQFFKILFDQFWAKATPYTG